MADQVGFPSYLVEKEKFKKKFKKYHGVSIGKKSVTSTTH